MIIGIIGGVGSGKSVTATKMILQSNQMCYVNYDIKAPNTLRLKKEHIVIEEKTDKKKKEYKVNWDFWNKALHKHKEYNLFLDEFHNIAHSRQSMTKWNTLMSIWISQIRKILGTKERTHIYLISQKLNRIDIAFRDLMHILISCKKFPTKMMINTKVIEDGKVIIKKLPLTYILLHYFQGENVVSAYQLFLEGYKTYAGRSCFIANPFYQYYDSYQMFGETAYL